MMALRRDWLRWVRATLLVGLACILFWEVASRTFVAYLANGSTEKALALRPHQPTALLNIAERKLSEIDRASDPRDKNSQTPSAELAVDAMIRLTAMSALLNDPLNARALRIIGQVADRLHDETQAWKFMKTSARYSTSESLALAWLADKAFEKKDFEGALQYIDVLLRTRPQSIASVISTLGQLAEDKRAVGDLEKLLSHNPPWRGAFFEALPNNMTDARTPLELFMAIKSSPNPPTGEDLRGYLNFLISRKFYQLAYYAWLQFLPDEELGSVGLLFNGNFETPPSGLPFDWIITPGTGVSIDIGPGPDPEQGRALNVTFDQGRVEFGAVTQLVALAPGKYQFNTQFMGEVIGQRGLKWRIVCAGGPTIAESQMITTKAATWKTSQFTFAVQSDCPAQLVRLDLDARMSSEQFVSGSIWFDNVRLSRVGEFDK